MPQSLSVNRVLFFVLVLMTPIPFALDEYAPSMPAMAEHFHSSIGSVQLTITVFMIAMGVSQLFAGPISDFFGRKKPLLFTLALYIIGSLLCVFATEFWMLIVGRILQGMGLCISNLLALAIQADTLEQKDIVKVSAYFSLGYSFIPIIAPVLGGYLQHWFGWRSNFFFLLLIGVVAWAIHFFTLPETLPKDRRIKAHPVQLAKNYLKVISNRSYGPSVVCLALCNAPLFVFSLVAPFTLQSGLGLNAAQYGEMALFVGVGFLVGNIATSYLLKKEKMSVEKIMLYGLSAGIVIAAIQFVIACDFKETVASVVIPSVLLAACIGFTLPCMFGRAASVFKSLAGIASSLVGCVIQFGIAITTIVLAAMHAHNLKQIAGAYLVLMILCAAVNYLIYKKPVGYQDP